MFFLTLLSLAALCLSLPRQTPIQVQIANEVLAQSKVFSDNAKSEVLNLIADEMTRKYLVELEPDLLKLSPSELLERFWNEMSVSEIVHSFDNPDHSCGRDITVEMAMAPDFSYFYNQWLLQNLNYTVVDHGNDRITEDVESNYFGFPQFANANFSPTSDWRPDYNMSADRPIYAAINMYRASGGNPQCGAVTAVMSRAYLKDQFVGAPVDTGDFELFCGRGEKVGWWGNMSFICEWPRDEKTGKYQLGTLPYLNHFVRPFLVFYNATQAIAGESNYVQYNLARLLARGLSRDTYQRAGMDNRSIRLNFMENTWGYFELNLCQSVTFKDGIKMIIAMYEMVWGSEKGNLLRKLCIMNNWPLVWAFNPVASYFRDIKDLPPNLAIGNELANVRLMDPYVLGSVSAGYNVTIIASDRVAFEKSWRLIDVTKVSRSKRVVGWDDMSAQFRESNLLVEPIFYGSCANTECVGVTVLTKKCVCRP